MFQTLWLLLTYSYNVVLVLFIATHLFVGAIISFLTGMYMGVYLSQNFEVPRISEPRLVWEKFLQFLEKNRRDPEKVKVVNVLRPSTIKGLVVAEQKAESASAAAVLVQEVEEESPSKTETIYVPEKRDSATFAQTGSQTEIGGLFSNSNNKHERDQINTTTETTRAMATSNYLRMGEAEAAEEEDYEEDEEEREDGDFSFGVAFGGIRDLSSTDEDTTLVPNVAFPLDNRISSSNGNRSRGSPTTLILTDPEDLSEGGGGFKIISSPQIVEGSLTLDKDRAISRSLTKLN